MVALEAEHVLGLDNYYFYIRGFMKLYPWLYEILRWIGVAYTAR